MQYQYFSKNGDLLPMSQAVIPVDNIHYQYGFGVYETLKVRNTVLYFAIQHAERLMDSARLIGLEHLFTKEQIIGYIQELVKKNTMESGNIKMLLIGGKTPEESLLFILPLAPLFPDKKLYSQGASVVTTQYQRFLPNAKTLNMLPSYLLYTKASKNGQYDMLLLDTNDNILEGTRTNFFAIKGITLITPPQETVLDGVTRQTVIAVAKKNGCIVKEEKIPLSSLQDFDGAFLTSTSTKIIPLRQIDEVILEIPEDLKQLMRFYDKFLEESSGIFEK